MWHRFEAAWKNPECDRIYEHLRREMEIDRRYEALEDKVGYLHFIYVLSSKESCICLHELFLCHTSLFQFVQAILAICA